MKTTDVIIQSLFLLTAIGLLIYSAWETEAFMMIMILQFWLGAWQILSFLISLLSIKRFSESIKAGYIYYAATVFIYMVIGFAGSLIRIDETYTMLYLFGPPWLIALYYYRLCILKMKFKKEDHAFLSIQ